MKYMIVSDIHGSGFYAQKAVDSFFEEKCGRMILLGDILYHGPRNELPKEYDPKRVAELFNGIKENILAVRGNCDAEVDQMVLEFPIRADYALLDAGEKLVFITHGHLFNEDNLPNIKKGDILLHGHTHIPTLKDTGKCIIMNPGSAALPKENSYNGFMTFENGLFLWKDFDGTVKDRFEI